MTRTYMPTPDVAIRAEAVVGEGPVWDSRQNKLAWVDLDPGILHLSDLSDGSDQATTIGPTLGAVAPRWQDGWAAAAGDGFGLITGGRLSIADPVLPGGDYRMNDAKCDASGRMWAGSTTFSQTPGAGALHCWDGVKPSRVAKTGLTLPNGIGWSPDGRTMYLADSLRHTVYAAPFDLADGTVGDLKPLIHVPHAYPDGLCVADDGSMWLALWGAGQIQRLAPDGSLLATVIVPAKQTTSCAIASDGTLYITSARRGLSEASLRLQPLSGSVFAVDSGTSPVPVAPFAA